MSLTGVVQALAGQASSASPGLATYADPGQRFSFRYPTSFGMASAGTNNGFGTRVAAVRFSAFSAAGIGGEAVLTRDRVLVDVQALGGLYDPFAREAFPEPLLEAIDRQLPLLTVRNFCDQLGRVTHLDINEPPFAALNATQRNALSASDAMGSVNPLVHVCRIEADAIVFHKEAAVVQGGPRRHVFGAIRFMDSGFSSFQIVQARQQVDGSVLQVLGDVVQSFRILP